MDLSRMGRLGVLTTTVILAFTGCGGAGTGTTGAVVPQGIAPTLRATHDKSWMTAKANFHHPWLYVSDTANNVVYIYDLGKTGISLIGKITDGLNGPFGLAVVTFGCKA